MTDETNANDSDQTFPNSQDTQATPQETAGRRQRRIVLVVSLLVALAGFSYLAFGDLGENLVYYWSPSELKEAGTTAYGAQVRLGGLVKEGTVTRGTEGLALQFEVTDGSHVVPVRASSVPPAMFREGIGVVLEGTLHPDGHFDTDRLMVKHDNEYQAPDTPNEKSMDELLDTLQFDT